MTATVVATEVAAYLAAVRAALSDLGADERDDLLVEVEASVIETAGEDDRPIVERLGPPDEFAAELRASAGLPPAAPAPVPAAASPGLLAAARSTLAEVLADRRVRAVGGALAELAPIWWVARAYVAVVLLGGLTGAHWSISHPAVPRIGSGRAAAFFLVAAVVASIVLGLRERRRGGGRGSRAILAVNALLAILAVPVLAHVVQVASAPAPRDYVVIGASSAPDVPTLMSGGQPVLNIYPYTRDGRLLHDVLLFDDQGRPLDFRAGDTDPTRQILTAPGGQSIFNSYPIRFFEPGTKRVANPNAAPPIAVPRPFTPVARPRRVSKAAAHQGGAHR